MSGIKDALLGDTPYVPTEFHGETYDAERDFERLAAQARKVADALSDFEWHTLAWLSEQTGAPEASVSARIRGLRKAGFSTERRYVEGGLHEYRLIRRGRAA